MMDASAKGMNLLVMSIDKTHVTNLDIKNKIQLCPSSKSTPFDLYYKDVNNTQRTMVNVILGFTTIIGNGMHKKPTQNMSCSYGSI
jgi:hypothetical protein